MGERRILFICEGLEDEPAFLKRLMEVSYPALSYRIYPYKTTIHTLASKLEMDYPDFDSGDMDINLILREMETDEGKKKFLSEKYSDIVLAFDFEPHHDRPNFKTVLRMLAYFTDSSDMGKLYINYPMMQSFKHFYCFPDLGYRTRFASPYRYKERVGEESRFSDLTKYTYETFVRIAVQNIKKAYDILYSQYILPSCDDYLAVEWSKIYLQEVAIFQERSETHVLNTLSFFLIDYNPTRFLEMVVRHPEKYDS